MVELCVVHIFNFVNHCHYKQTKDFLIPRLMYGRPFYFHLNFENVANIYRIGLSCYNKGNTAVIV